MNAGFVTPGGRGRWRGLAARRRAWVLGLLAGAAACEGDVTVPEESLPRQGESQHFAYFSTSPGQVDTAYQERHYAWVVTKLALSYPGKIGYYRYADRAHLERATGKVTNGFAEPEKGRFHSIWPTDNHEYVHVLFASQVGLPSALFTEGVAVAHQGASFTGSFDGPPLWNGSSVNQLARKHLAEGTLPSLDQLVESNRFRSHDSQMTYPIAGSFVRYLIDQAGVERFKQFAARSGNTDSQRTIESDFQAVYGESLASWWSRWHAFLLTSSTP